MLDRKNTLLLVVDVQERLLPHIHDHANMTDRLARFIRGTEILTVPTIVSEQYVKGLGSTVPAIQDALKAYEPLEKKAFSCMGDEAMAAAIKATRRKEILLTGIETHVCVYQTACHLLERGYGVHLVTDCVSSRTAENRDLAIRKLDAQGAQMTSMEMALFELMGVSGTDEFKAVSKLVK